jgi:tricorn protease
MKRYGILLLAFFIFASATAFAHAEEGRLMRFPDIHGDKIVFTYAGDLWLVSKEGGIARKITSDPGLELTAKFSPDGKWIAFTGQYDGNFNVFVIPSEGGVPKQLTHEPDPQHMPERFGPNNQILDWYPDGKKILYFTRKRTYNSWFGSHYYISMEGGLPEALPLPKGGLTSFSPDGKKIAYNRIFRNFRTWKHYRGGMAQDIWIYDFEKNEIEKITEYLGTDTYPMWNDDKIYFGSDRGDSNRMNIYSYDLNTKEIKQLTNFDEFDVNWPSLGPDFIVFENGGFLYLLNLNTEEVKKVTISLPGDRAGAKDSWEKVKSNVTEFDISPDGKRAIFVARGDVYTVPQREGNTRNLTATSGVHEKYSSWSPDGKWIAYVSDKSGEDEIYVIPGTGEGEEIRVTTDGNCFKYFPIWSPDSKKLAFSDKSLRLFYVEIDEKKPALVDQARYWEIRSYDWSPDSKWITYAKPHETRFYSVYLYSLESKKITPVTTEFTNDYSPEFDPEGEYLYFLSDRDYKALRSAFDFTIAYQKETRVYAVTLKADAPSPLAPRSDEAEIKEEEEDKEEKGKDEKKKEKNKSKKIKKGEKATEEDKEEEEKKEFRIDLEGIGERIIAFPMDPANMGGIAAAKGMLFYISSPVAGFSGPYPGEERKLHMFDLKERKDFVIMSPINGFVLNSNGDKIIYSSNSTHGIIDVAPVGKPGGKPATHNAGDGAVDISGLEVKIDKRAEWKQMFHEAWRLQRDFFFSPVMQGLDWEKIRNMYAELLPHIAHRFDLTYILGEMLGELANSHTYVGGGDMPDLKPVNIGYLGVDFAVDPGSKLYTFKKIYEGQNWKMAYRSPLTEPGIDVKEEDFLIAVDGKELKSPVNPYSLFENKAGKIVKLTVNSKPSKEGAKAIEVKPISSEYNLRYLNWVEGNRKKVEEASDGQIGYVYIPDMSGGGLNEFFRQYFPQIKKKGLIVDVRYNGGGFVDQLILERLRRILVGMSISRNAEKRTIPGQVFHGHMACVTNEYAASDGDIFTYYFKKYELGPVIGKRTWGGVRGIRGYTPLMDGGYVTQPEFSIYGLDSKWVMENWGAEVDIVVDNRPDLVVQGRDPQLEKTIEYLMKKIKEEPKELPERPPYLPAYPEEGKWRE